MLAPLEDRSLLERDDGDPQRDPPLADFPADLEPDVARLAAENAALRKALRESRRTQRRNATLTARKVVDQTNEIYRLGELNGQLQKRLAEYESGLAITSLAQQLMALREANEQLTAAATRVWYLDKTLCAAHRECELLARERDSALGRLRTATSELPN
ncbi:hypothetical protein ACLIKD_13265 [Azonexus sp. IMCC34842]|uniref:hypothetical protein n=1 Tax=Azonexus sp. IMCC34842 TaxID=3420950 RepID=UPI003D0BCB37